MNDIRVVLMVAVSVDGKIAEDVEQTSLDWTSKEDKAFFVEKTKELGVLVMGGRTYATIGRPLKGRRIIVLSREGGTLETLGEPGSVVFVHMPVRALVEALAAQGCTSVVIAGGASVYSQFLREGLVDEMYVTVEPYVFGSGVSLASDTGRVQMRLQSMRQLGTQAVLLHYFVERL